MPPKKTRAPSSKRPAPARLTKSQRTNHSAPKNSSPLNAAKPFLVVGVGASAGGIEAFKELLKNVPENIGVAFVFILHLDPNHKSMLTEIFGRESRLNVVEIESDMRVQPNHVYVLPQNRHVVISEGILQLEPRKRNDGQHRPIDYFFSSLARDQGNCAVGVLLSGNGSDGVVGLEEIKAEGGVTFAQNEATAAFPAMPRYALAAGCVDFVSPPQIIARELKRIARHPALVQGSTGKAEHIASETESDLHRVFSLLRALTGVDFAYYKHSTIKRRIMRRMVLRKIERLGDYVRYMQQNPG